jgi:hypothetical protein
VAIGELELPRAAGDRRLYVLADVGIVPLKGGGRHGPRAPRRRSWETASRGLWRRAVKVTVDKSWVLDVDPGVPLLAAFVVGGLVKDGSADAAHRRSG